MSLIRVHPFSPSEIRSKADGNPATRGRASERGDATSSAGNYATAGRDEATSDKAGLKARSGLDRPVELRPPKMSFASSTKKTSESSLPMDRKASEENAKSFTVSQKADVSVLNFRHFLALTCSHMLMLGKQRLWTGITATEIEI